jgi:UPF0716 protein FxsA
VLAVLALVLVAVPIAEVVVLGQVQRWLGWPTTLLILVLTSLAGAWLLRMQGALAWRRFTRALAEGRVPADEVVDGALILFGAALLLTPGFLTDVTGLLCVLTPSRVLLRRLVRRRVAVVPGPVGAVLGGGRRPRRAADPSTRGPASSPRAGRAGPDGVVDVEVLEVRRTPRTPPRAVGDEPPAAP